MAYNNTEPGSQFPFPIIADDRRELVETLGMLDPEEKDHSGMPLSARCVSAEFINTGLEISVESVLGFAFVQQGVSEHLKNMFVPIHLNINICEIVENSDIVLC